jgi:hypothetical protein
MIDLPDIVKYAETAISTFDSLLAIKEFPSGTSWTGVDTTSEYGGIRLLADYSRATSAKRDPPAGYLSELFKDRVFNTSPVYVQSSTSLLSLGLALQSQMSDISSDITKISVTDVPQKTIYTSLVNIHSKFAAMNSTLDYIHSQAVSIASNGTNVGTPITSSNDLQKLNDAAASTAATGTAAADVLSTLITTSNTRSTALAAAVAATVKAEEEVTAAGANPATGVSLATAAQIGTLANAKAAELTAQRAANEAQSAVAAQTLIANKAAADAALAAEAVEAATASGPQPDFPLRAIASNTAIAIRTAASASILAAESSKAFADSIDFEVERRSIEPTTVATLTVSAVTMAVAVAGLGIMLKNEFHNRRARIAPPPKRN